MPTKNGDLSYGNRQGTQKTTDGPLNDPDGRYGVPRMKKTESMPKGRRDPSELNVNDSQ